jgi:hypothetical protein
MIWSDQQRDDNDYMVQLVILMAYTPYRVSRPVHTIDSGMKKKRRKLVFCSKFSFSYTFVYVYLYESIIRLPQKGNNEYNTLCYRILKAYIIHSPCLVLQYMHKQKSEYNISVYETRCQTLNFRIEFFVLRTVLIE